MGMAWMDVMSRHFRQPTGCIVFGDHGYGSVWTHAGHKGGNETGPGEMSTRSACEHGSSGGRLAIAEHEAGGEQGMRRDP